MRKGAAALSDKDLLAVLIGSGNKQASVFEIAEKVLSLIDRKGLSIGPEDFNSVLGMGTARSCLLCAALEFSRRKICPAATRISSPQEAYALVRHFSDRKQEHFLCLSLNGAHEVLALRVVSVGLVNRTVVHAREVFAEPLTDRAAAIICAHNHPSGNINPSLEDKQVTEKLKKAGELLGVPMLDHLVFSEREFFSFAEENLL